MSVCACVRMLLSFPLFVPLLLTRAEGRQPLGTEPWVQAALAAHSSVRAHA